MSTATNSAGHCQQITKILGQLRQELEAVADGHPLHEDPIHPFLVCTELRSLMRNIADQLECKSRLVEFEKQKIEKKKNYLESLEYYKVLVILSQSMLQNQIEVCAINVEDVQDVVEEECRPEDWLQGFPQAGGKLKSWMEQAENQKAALARKKLHRQSVDAEIKKKKKLYNQQLPAHLTKIEEGLRTVMNVFDMSPTYLLNPIRNEKLAGVYSYLAPLQQLGVVSLSFQEDVLTLTIAPSTQNNDIKLANSVKLALEPKEIKLHVSILGSRVVLSIDRSCDFTSEELLHRLISNEPLLPIYSNPHTEEQRNCNTRYQYFNWLQNLGTTTDNFPLTSQQFITKLVDRSLCVQILKLLVDGLRSSKLPWYCKVGSQATTSNFHLKKLQVVSVTKVNGDMARQKLYCPKFIKQLLELRPPTDKQTLPLQQLLREYLHERPAQGQNNSPLFSFYEVALTYHNQAVEFMWVVPCSYPESRSKVKLLQYYATNSKEPTHPIREKSLLKLAPPAGASLPTVNGECSERKPADIVRMERIEEEVNADLAQFGVQHHPNFYLLYQLNRLLTVLDQMHHHQDERSLKRYQQ